MPLNGAHRGDFVTCFSSGCPGLTQRTVQIDEIGMLSARFQCSLEGPAPHRAFV
jgi:hypothetical protein